MTRDERLQAIEDKLTVTLEEAADELQVAVAKSNASTASEWAETVGATVGALAELREQIATEEY